MMYRAILILFITTTPLFAQQMIVPDQFARIQDAIDASAFGDTILVRPGSYHEYLQLAEGVVLRSEGVEDGRWTRALRTIIHSEGLRDGNGKIPPVVNCADHAVIDGFTITGMDTVNHHLPGHSHAVQNRGTSSTIMHCIVHSNGSTGIGSHDKDGRQANPTILFNKVYWNYGIGIGFNHTSKGEARGNEVYENREVGIGLQNGASPLVIENVVHHNGWNGISAREGAWPRIESNTVYENGTEPTGEGAPPGTGAGIGLDSCGWIARNGEIPAPTVVKGNLVYANPSGGIMSRNYAVFEVDSNYCYRNGNMQIAITDESDGIVHRNTVERGDDVLQTGGIAIVRGAKAQILYNTVRGFPSAGIIADSANHTIIAENMVSDCNGSGINISESQPSIRVEKNMIADCAGPGMIIGPGNAVIRRNVLAGNSGGVTIGPESMVAFVNNTIVASAGSQGRGVAVNGRLGSMCINNIVHGYAVGFYLEERPAIDYNCTYANQGYNGPPGTGGAHAVYGDPRFANITNRDFRLQQGSPCIDAGHPGEQYLDADGSRCDIGALNITVPPVHVSTPASPQDARLVVYPTISSGRVNVLIESPFSFQSQCTLRVYSTDGVLQRSEVLPGGHASVNLSGLPRGTYLLQAQSSQTVLTAKVQLQ